MPLGLIVVVGPPSAGFRVVVTDGLVVEPVEFGLLVEAPTGVVDETFGLEVEVG